MARASTPTLIALDDFARIMGINPMHFNGALAPSVTDQPMPLPNARSDMYFQYSWQNADAVSREEIAMLLAEAEEDIRIFAGFPVGLTWIEGEQHLYGRYYRKDVYTRGLGVRARLRRIKTRNGWLVTGGRKATSLVGTATTAGGTLVYSDADSDGLSETATITLATALTDVTEIKAFFASQSALPEWEIRPPRSITISGGNVVITFWSWQLIDPDLWEAFPTVAGPSAIDISTTTNFVTSVDVYRVYNDDTQAASVFSWGSDCAYCDGTGCTACNTVTQNGCLRVEQEFEGVTMPYPGSYEADNARWVEAEWTETVEPDSVKLWYQAGLTSPKYDDGLTNYPVPERLARAACYMAVARMERNICTGGNVETLSSYLRQDLARLSDGPRFLLGRKKLDNPFGTRRGEVEAWRTVNQLTRTVPSFGVI